MAPPLLLCLFGNHNEDREQHEQRSIMIERLHKLYDDTFPDHISTVKTINLETDQYAMSSQKRGVSFSSTDKINASDSSLKLYGSASWGIEFKVPVKISLSYDKI